MVNPHDDGAAQAPDVHSASDVYARRFGGVAGRYLLDVQEQAIRRVIDLPPGARILDIGGGHAQAALPLAAMGYDVTVLASAESAAARVRALAGNRIAVVIGALDDPPFPDAAFDAVIALRMMAHVADWRALVAGASRVARRMVVVDFSIPGGSNALAPLLFAVKKAVEGSTRRFATMSRADVRQAFAAHGFRVDAEIGQFVLPVVVHRVLSAPRLSRMLETALRRCGLAARVGTPVIARAVRAAAGGPDDAHPGSGAAAVLHQPRDAAGGARPARDAGGGGTRP